ncbi:hypothetical protein PHYSODRAFT_517664, partial [Phytophthora sojae]
QMQIECLHGHCGSGHECSNQQLQRQAFPLRYIAHLESKGISLMAGDAIGPKQCIGEYTGEVITKQQYKHRLQRARSNCHIYGMLLNNQDVIDATRKGSIIRFANHSCSANAVIERWEVDGEEYCGLYALEAIAKDNEISFDYRAETFMGRVSTRCYCKASNCRGYVAI